MSATDKHDLYILDKMAAYNALITPGAKIEVKWAVVDELEVESELQDTPADADAELEAYQIRWSQDHFRECEADVLPVLVITTDKRKVVIAVFADIEMAILSVD